MGNYPVGTHDVLDGLLWCVGRTVLTCTVRAPLLSFGLTTSVTPVSSLVTFYSIPVQYGSEQKIRTSQVIQCGKQGTSTYKGNETSNR